MKPKYILVLTFLVGLLLLSGCNFPRQPLICPPEKLVAPSILYKPHNYEIIEQPLTFEWSQIRAFLDPEPYPSEPLQNPSDKTRCFPEKYHVSISTSPLFEDDLGGDVQGYFGVVPQTNDKYPVIEHDKHGVFQAPILPGAHLYRWSVIPISHGVEGPQSEIRYFKVGEPCDDYKKDYVNPELIEPVNGAIIYIDQTIYKFKNLNDCFQDNLTMETSLSPRFEYSNFVNYNLTRNYHIENETGYFSGLWEGYKYYWHIITEFRSGSIETETRWFYVCPRNIDCSINLDQSPMVVTKIPTPPQIPLDSVWEVILDTKCRLGPATAYPETGYLPIGHMAKILGRNEDGTWFRVMDPNGVACWGSVIAFDVPEGWDELEILRYDPLPTSIATTVPPYDCSQHKDQVSCSAQSACVWEPIAGVINLGVCKNK